MSAISPADIIVELEDAIAGRSPERCTRMLWQTTNLLVAGRDRLQEPEIGVLDEVLVRLMQRVEPGVLAQLSATLAELKTAPMETLRRLASHDDPAVAGPALLKSAALSQVDLEAIATSRGEQHLLAIAGRRKVEQASTDVLLKRAGANVWRALAKNPGARFSETGYAQLAAMAERDSEIAKALALRPDTPAAVLRDLLARVPQAVKASILEAGPSGLRERIDVSASVSGQGSKQPQAVDYADAKPGIVALNRIGKLNDSTVNRFAIRGESANLITALSVLSGAPIEIIESVLADTDCEGLIMACRASRLNWQTTLAILSNRGISRLSDQDRERARQLFETLCLSTSQWTVRWGELAAGAGPTSTVGSAAKVGANR